MAYSPTAEGAMLDLRYKQSASAEDKATDDVTVRWGEISDTSPCDSGSRGKNEK